MDSITHSKRKSNFELLRIFAMLIIVACHYGTHGIERLYESGQLQQWSEGSVSHKLFTCFLVPGGETGVAIFFMLTGYFMINKNHFSLLKVILECIFYGIFTGIIYIILKPVGILNQYIGIYDLIKQTMIPVSGGAWWFPTAYVLLLVISPLLNRFLNGLNDKGFFGFLLIDWLLWYVVPMVLGGGYTGLERGIFFYTLGSAIRTRHIQKDNKRLLYIILFVIGWTGFSLLDYRWTAIWNADLINGYSKTGTLIRMLITGINSGIFVPLCALSIFMLFETLKVGSKAVINTLAACTFGVYLLHDSLVGGTLFWKIIFNVAERQYFSRFYPVLAIGTIAIIYVICSLIDFIRLKVFETRALKIANKIITNWKEKYSTKQ
jgi:surface polysaccharide O-acyltransferase-like enzyme